MMAFWKMNKDEKLLVGVGFARSLSTGVALTGVPTVKVYAGSDGTGAESTGWTVASVQLNAAVVTDHLGFAHQANEAVQCLLGPSTYAAGLYVAKVEADTTDGQHLVEPVTLRLTDEG